MYQDLLLPIEDFYFYKVQNVGFKGYVSKSGNFEIRTTIHQKKKYWTWKICKKSLFLGSAWPYSSSYFSSWKAARNDVLEKLEKAFPEQTFDPAVKQLKDNRYYVRHQAEIKTCPIIISRFTNSHLSNWRAYTRSTTSSELTGLLAEDFVTRQKAIEGLHSFVAENLDTLYKNQRQQFVWWRIFLQPEVKLKKIFDYAPKKLYY